MTNLKKITDWNALKALLENASEVDAKVKFTEEGFYNGLQQRVKGQDTILKDVARLIRLQMAAKQNHRPLCNLLFLGPTGTGKTELAKAIAEFLYGDEKAMLRFDCSEFTSAHSKDRLIGMPTGYVGSESGGHLTRPMFSNPKRVVLFDEIEKADRSIFDLFLQLMGEGRLSEQGSGKVADFTQSIIIMTSNAHSEAIGKIQREYSDYVEMLNAVKGHLADTQVFRPEILGRIDKVYVFENLDGLVVAEIALLKISKLAKSFGLDVEFIAPELIVSTLESNKKISRFGIRELERIIFDMFASAFANAKDQGLKSARLQLDSSGKVVITKKKQAA